MGGEGDRVGPRLARGCRCFGIFQGKDVVAYGWLSARPEWIGELSIEISPSTGEAYVWNCVTAQAHRRRGMYRALLEGMVAQSRDEGLRRLWIGSVEDPAEKADADAGFVPVLSFTTRKLGPLRWLSASPAPGADARLTLAARDRLGLSSWTTIAPARARKH
jgi:GNAT superfamily N-acetyltransferase